MKITTITFNYYILLALLIFNKAFFAQSNLQWMDKNLSATTFQNGDSILQIMNDEDWEKAGNDKIPAFTYQIFNDTIRSTLYNYYAVVDPRGLAPKGWRIPNMKELKLIDSSIIGQIFCFGKNFGGTFSNSGMMTGFWSSTPYDDDFAYFLQYTGWKNKEFNSDWGLKGLGFSVRCLRSD